MEEGGRVPRASSSFYFVKLCMQLITGYNMHRTDRSLMDDFTFWIRDSGNLAMV